jgi:hypothetical protein
MRTLRYINPRRPAPPVCICLSPARGSLIAHMPNSGMCAPPAVILPTQGTKVATVCASAYELWNAMVNFPSILALVAPEIVLLVSGLSSISSVTAGVFPDCQIGFLGRPTELLR